MVLGMILGLSMDDGGWGGSLRDGALSISSRPLIISPAVRIAVSIAAGRTPGGRRLADKAKAGEGAGAPSGQALTAPCTRREPEGTISRPRTARGVVIRTRDGRSCTSRQKAAGLPPGGRCS